MTTDNDDLFGRRSEALGQALRDLLVDVPDATPAEQAERVRQVTSKLGQAWHATRAPESPVEVAYVAFLTHLRGCPEWCNSGNGRCDDGERLWAAYKRSRGAQP
ncbi:hypothetical protein ACFXJ5_17000 [Streptomyces sp. NPDC059373]